MSCVLIQKGFIMKVFEKKNLFWFASAGFVVLVLIFASFFLNQKLERSQSVSIQNATALTLKDVKLTINNEYETVIAEVKPFSTVPVELSANGNPSDSAFSRDSAILSIDVSCDRGDGERFGNNFYEAFPEQIILTISEDENGKLGFSANSMDD